MITSNLEPSSAGIYLFKVNNSQQSQNSQKNALNMYFYNYKTITITV